MYSASSLVFVNNSIDPHTLLSFKYFNTNLATLLMEPFRCFTSMSYFLIVLSTRIEHFLPVPLIKFAASFKFPIVAESPILTILWELMFCRRSRLTVKCVPLSLPINSCTSSTMTHLRCFR